MRLKSALHSSVYLCRSELPSISCVSQQYRPNSVNFFGHRYNVRVFTCICPVVLQVVQVSLSACKGPQCYCYHQRYHHLVRAISTTNTTHCLGKLFYVDVLSLFGFAHFNVTKYSSPFSQHSIAQVTSKFWPPSRNRPMPKFLYKNVQNKIYRPAFILLIMWKLIELVEEKFRYLPININCTSCRFYRLTGFDDSLTLQYLWLIQKILLGP